MTEYGYCVDFSIVNYATIAPECFYLESKYDRKHFDHSTVVNNNDLLNIELNNSKADVWSFGALLFQFLYGLGTQNDNSHAKKLNDLLSIERIVELVIDSFDKNDSESCSTGYEYLLKLFEISNERRQLIELFRPNTGQQTERTQQGRT